MKPNQLHSFISCARLVKAFEPCCGLGSLGSRLGNGVWCTGCLLGNVRGINICGREGKEISLGWRRKRQQHRCHKASADSTESSGTNVTHQSCPAWALLQSVPGWGGSLQQRQSPKELTAKDGSRLTALRAAGAISALEGGSGQHSFVSITGVFLPSTAQVKHLQILIFWFLLLTSERLQFVWWGSYLPQIVVTMSGYIPVALIGLWCFTSLIHAH